MYRVVIEEVGSYNHGGVAVSTQCFVLMGEDNREVNDRLLWAGEVKRKAERLRSFFNQNSKERARLGTRNDMPREPLPVLTKSVGNGGRLRRVRRWLIIEPQERVFDLVSSLSLSDLCL